MKLNRYCWKCDARMTLVSGYVWDGTAVCTRCHRVEQLGCGGSTCTYDGDPRTAAERAADDDYRAATAYAADLRAELRA